MGWRRSEYHVPDLEKLIKAVDFQCIPIRCMTRITIPLLGVLKFENNLTKKKKLNAVMIRARNYAKTQYNSCKLHEKFRSK
jgi:hypothetical protein